MRSESEIVGIVGFASMVVRPGDCLAALGVGDLPILATSHLANLMESASVCILDDFLEPGESSRLTKIGIEVLDSVAIGSEIRASATCTDLLGRELTFMCDVYQGDREIARAEMKRAVVERVSFLARTAAQSIMGQTPH
jgi:predicted thioesterase